VKKDYRYGQGFVFQIPQVASSIFTSGDLASA
jgi:hypothetical protein